MAQHTYTTELAALFTERMLKALTARRMTRIELETELYASKTKVIAYINMLHGKVEGFPKRIYICSYDVRSNGGRVPRYAVGNRPDARPKPRKTMADRWREIKGSQEKHERRKAVMRADTRLRKLRAKPANPFSALGL